jgi:ABC-2 type transport system permease protein
VSLLGAIDPTTVSQMGALGVYVAVTRLSFRRQVTYRGAMLAALFTNVVFGMIVAGLMKTVVAERGVIDGWDSIDFVTATFAAQALLGPIAAFGDRELSGRVMTGEVAMDFVRPTHLVPWSIASFFGKAIAQGAVRSAPTFLAGMLVFHVRLPNLASAAATVISVVLAVGIASAWWMVVNLTSFWILNAKGTIQFATVTGYVLSGISFSLVLLPPGWEAIARGLPFASLVQFPVEVFLGKHHTASDLLGVFATQAGWFIAMVALAVAMTRAGHTKLVLQGG